MQKEVKNQYKIFEKLNFLSINEGAIILESFNVVSRFYFMLS